MFGMSNLILYVLYPFVFLRGGSVRMYAVQTSNGLK